MSTSRRSAPTTSFGYVCGALTVSLDPKSPSVGPRAHVAGFLNGLRASGVRPEIYLAGDTRAVMALLRARRPTRTGGAGNTLSVSTTWSSRKRDAIGALKDALRLVAAWFVGISARRRVKGVDVVYERLATFSRIGARLQRRGAVWIVESNGPFWYEASVERKRLTLVSIARELELKCYASADLVVVVSEALKAIIVQAANITAEKVIVVPNATDSTRFDPESSSARRIYEAPTIGFCGYLTEWAGIDLLLQAVAMVRESGAQLSAVIIGAGPAKLALKVLAESLGISDAVTFTGQVDWNEIPAYILGFDLSYSGQRAMSIGSMYHSPQKIYEYMAMGVPVVASAHSDAKAVIDGRAGWVFESNNSASLAATLRLALADPAERALRGANGRRDVLAKHNWNTRVGSVLEELRRRNLIG